MKKSSRITNTIKYFGISSATLLAAAPVVAPTVTSALGWYGANSVFTAKSSSDAKADLTGLSFFDRSGYSDYDNLFQSAVKVSLGSNNTVEPGKFKTIDSDIDVLSDGSGKVGSQGVSYSAIEGIRQIAQLTGGFGSLPDGVFHNPGVRGGVPNAQDFMHYMFTNTDGSTRTSMDGLSSNLSGELKLNLNSTVDKSKMSNGEMIALGLHYLSTYLDGGTVAGVLGSSVFGNPNKATLKVYIDGKNGDATPSLISLLQEGVITVTLVATSGDGSGKTAQANIIVRNTTPLFKGANPAQLSAGLDRLGFVNGGGYGGNSLLSNAGDLSSNLPNLGRVQVNGSGSFYSVVSSGAVPSLQTGYFGSAAGSAADSAGLGGITKFREAYKSDFFKGFYADWKTYESLSVNQIAPRHSVDSIAWQDTDPTAENYIGGVAAYHERKGYPATVDYDKKLKVIDENVGALPTGSIVVPAGTSYEDIVNKFKNLAYVGNPSSQEYQTDVEDPMSLSFDNVKPKAGYIEGYTWDKVLKNAGALDNFRDKYKGANGSVTDLKDAVVTKSFSVDVPVYGDIAIPQSTSLVNSGGEPVSYQRPKEKDTFIKGYGGLKDRDRVTAKVNVVVYDKKWDEYTVGTKPSFLMFTKPAGSSKLYPTIYDDGATLSQSELPKGLNQALNFSVNDKRFTTDGSSGFSAQKLASYVAEQFGKEVANKNILISDEDKATSDKKIDISNLPADQDFPGADKYTVRSNLQGKNITVDASGVDITKPGNGTLKITYTNSKNEHGVGSESSTISVPYQVGAVTTPVLYFVNGVNQTIKVGDNFNAMLFKVTKDQDSMDALVSSGKVFDGAPYVNDPDRTGLSVTVSGSVDTNKPGNYVLTYTAKNVSSGATTTITRYITVLDGNDSDFTITSNKTIGYINYVPGYGVNVYSAPNGRFTDQRLQHGTAWKIFRQAVSNKNPKEVWYEVGKNQWIKGEYVSMTPVSSMTPLNAVGRINYVPGYGVKVWSSSEGTGWTDKYLAHGTDWKIFGKQNGYYNLGGDQWVSEQYIEIVK